MILQYPDLLQLLVDARADSDDEDESTESDIYAKKLNNVEVIKTSFAFLAAGIAIVVVQLSSFKFDSSHRL